MFLPLSVFPHTLIYIIKPTDLMFDRKELSQTGTAEVVKGLPHPVCSREHASPSLPGQWSW